MEIFMNEYLDNCESKRHLINKILQQRNFLYDEVEMTLEDECYLECFERDTVARKNYYTAKKLLINGCTAYALRAYSISGEYTKLGGLVHNLKYNKFNNQIKENLDELMSLSYLNIRFLLPNTDFYLIPAPSFGENSVLTKKLPYMFTEFIRSEFIGAEFRNDLVHKKINFTSKTLKIGTELPDDCIVSDFFPCDKPIVVIDDLYGEGATARAIVRAIKSVGNNNEIIFISLTYNKYGGIKQL